MDDLIAISIISKNGQRLILVQRRTKAEETIQALAGSSSHERVVFRDVVGNPVVVDVGEVIDAQFLGVLGGPPLRDMLAPIPPGFDVALEVPEVARPSPGGANGARPPSAADQDPVEEVMSGSGGSMWGGTRK